MFISNDEKKYLFDQIKLLTTVSEKLIQMESRLNLWEGNVHSLYTETRSLETKTRSLESKFDALSLMVQAKQKIKQPMTPEQKEKQRGYAKAYHDRQKALKELA
jgi:hypothetical protein